MEKEASAFWKLKDFLSDFLQERKNPLYQNKYTELDNLVEQCYLYNGWFTKENVLKALQGIVLLLEENKLKEFCKQINKAKNHKIVAVIMAGNIPAVGFHDFMCVLLSGNKILIKPSSDDKFLITFFADFLKEVESLFNDRIDFAEGKLQNFDAVIATGSNNSSLYFERYFGKYPHIIRKNRSSVAILSGKESRGELTLLGNDVFDYYGLGCRNVSKLFVPKGYKFDIFYESVFGFSEVLMNKKYANNHEYNRAIYLLNREKFLDNNFLIIRESNSLHSPIGVLFYEEYESVDKVSERIKEQEEELQCIVSSLPLPFNTISFGETQSPFIHDFSDNINTLDFLNKL
jgi:acyl-CoA reductase LuxC